MSRYFMSIPELIQIALSYTKLKGNRIGKISCLWRVQLYPADKGPASYTYRPCSTIYYLLRIRVVNQHLCFLQSLSNTFQRNRYYEPINLCMH